MKLENAESISVRVVMTLITRLEDQSLTCDTSLGRQMTGPLLLLVDKPMNLWISFSSSLESPAISFRVLDFRLFDRGERKIEKRKVLGVGNRS